jgi:hypothetical protein
MRHSHAPSGKNVVGRAKVVEAAPNPVIVGGSQTRESGISKEETVQKKEREGVVADTCPDIDGSVRLD